MTREEGNQPRRGCCTLSCRLITQVCLPLAKKNRLFLCGCIKEKDKARSDAEVKWREGERGGLGGNDIGVKNKDVTTARSFFRAVPAETKIKTRWCVCCMRVGTGQKSTHYLFFLTLVPSAAACSHIHTFKREGQTSPHLPCSLRVADSLVPLKPLGAARSPGGTGLLPRGLRAVADAVVQGPAGVPRVAAARRAGRLRKRRRHRSRRRPGSKRLRRRRRVAGRGGGVRAEGGDGPALRLHGVDQCSQLRKRHDAVGELLRVHHHNAHVAGRHLRLAHADHLVDRAHPRVADEARRLRRLGQPQRVRGRVDRHGVRTPRRRRDDLVAQLLQRLERGGVPAVLVADEGGVRLEGGHLGVLQVLQRLGLRHGVVQRRCVVAVVEDLGAGLVRGRHGGDGGGVEAEEGAADDADGQDLVAVDEELHDVAGHARVVVVLHVVEAEHDAGRSGGDGREGEGGDDGTHYFVGVFSWRRKGIRTKGIQ
eukprot:Rhum_TRINITY_DN12932_c0_g1::Rhum_TRINITY_DN12932_c0_g1_i1::g.55279::m.55279